MFNCGAYDVTTSNSKTLHRGSRFSLWLEAINEKGKLDATYHVTNRRSNAMIVIDKNNIEKLASDFLAKYRATHKVTWLIIERGKIDESGVC